VLAGYRKVPLACPMPGYRDNLLMLCLMQFLGFEVFTRMGAGMERWMFGQPALFLLVPGSMLLAWLWHRMRLRDALEEGLMFENLRTPVVERLKLDEG
jgi:hypothetical protein